MSSQTIKISRNAGRIARERRVQLGLTQREVARRSGVSERTVYSFELGEKPGIHLSKMLAIYESLGLVLKVEVVDPPQRSGSEGLSSEQVIADFLAQMKGGLYGTD